MTESTDFLQQAAAAEQLKADVNRAIDRLLVGVPGAARYWDEVLLRLDPARPAEPRLTNDDKPVY